MWKKNERDPEPGFPSATPPAPAPAAPAAGPRSTSTIGASLTLQGEISGQEDLLVDGTVRGKIELRDSNVTVGRNGKVQADIHADGIRVDGEVKGNLFGGREVIVRKSGSVLGNIVAPRVVLEDGAKFKGAIDMEPDSKRRAGQPSLPGTAAPRSERDATRPGEGPAS